MACNCTTITSALKLSIFISCSFIFVFTTVAGIVLILAPEEPSLDLGGGSVYSLYCGIALLVLAGITLLSSLFGYICVCKDSRIGLCMYSLFLIIIAMFVAASASVLAVFTYSGMVESNLNNTLWSHLKYSTNVKLFDEIQANYSCCGVDHPSDWLKEDSNWKSNATLPSSCCANIEVYHNCTLTNSYTRGCLDVLMDRLEYVVDASFSVSIIGAVLLLITSCLVGYGSCVINKYQNYDIL